MIRQKDLNQNYLLHGMEANTASIVHDNVNNINSIKAMVLKSSIRNNY